MRLAEQVRFGDLTFLQSCSAISSMMLTLNSVRIGLGLASMVLLV